LCFKKREKYFGTLSKWRRVPDRIYLFEVGLTAADFHSVGEFQIGA